VGNPQVELTTLPGWHTGMAGTMCVLAKAKSAGFDISLCKPVYEKSWDYLSRHREEFLSTSNCGLFHGGPGVALAIAEGLNCNLLISDKTTIGLLQNCFSHISHSLDLADGVAGQGLAILRTLSFLDKSKSSELLSSSIEIITSKQTKSGTWKSHDTLDLYKGHTGIVLFLIFYLNRYSDRSASAVLDKALRWLLRKAFDKRGIYRSPEQVNFSTSFQGTMLCLIHSYKLLNLDHYKQLAEVNLRILPKRSISFDFTLQSGLASRGCLFLEAFRITKDNEWKHRANWIFELFEHTLQKRGGKCGAWMMTQNMLNTVDLFDGTAGILSFLLQLHNPNNDAHPLC
jgi:lantibiotic modifying enzyme